MKKTLVYTATLICLSFAISLAAEKNGTVPNRSSELKAVTVKTARMNARGKVIEISDTTIKIERTIKGNVEVMEFVVERPPKGIIVNDAVNIDYTVKEGKLSASRVARQVAAKASGENETRKVKDKSASRPQ
jgi:hypothetical protein